MPVLEALLIKGAVVLAKSAAGKFLAYKAAMAAGSAVTSATTVAGAVAGVGAVAKGVAGTVAATGAVAWTGEQAQKAVKLASDVHKGDLKGATKTAASLAYSLHGGIDISSGTETLGEFIREGGADPKLAAKLAKQGHSIGKEIVKARDA